MNTFVFRHGLSIGQRIDRPLSDAQKTKKMLRKSLATDVARVLFGLEEELHQLRARLLSEENESVGRLFTEGSIAEALRAANEAKVDYDNVFDNADCIFQENGQNAFREHQPSLLIEHSPLKRCAQTAVLLSESVVELGGKTKVKVNEDLSECSVVPVEKILEHEGLVGFEARLLVTHLPIIGKIQDYIFYNHDSSVSILTS